MQHPGFSFCFCPDSRLIRTQVEKSLADNAPASSDGWERHAYWGDDPLPAAFWENLTLQGLFSTPKALIVHNAQNIPADAWKRISAALACPLGDVWPFFCLQTEFERGQPKIPAHIARLQCLAFAEKRGWVWSSAGLDARSRAAFVQTEAKRLSLILAPGALEAVCARLPFDASAIAAEMEKIALAAPADGTVQASLAEILEYEPEPDIFSLIRLLQQGQTASVWRQTLASGRGTESMVFAFLAALAREARQLWQLLTGESVRLPPQIIPAKTALARSLGFAGTARLWQLALEADKGIKSGERSVDQAMENLIAGLSLLFRAAPSGRTPA